MVAILKHMAVQKTPVEMFFLNFFEPIIVGISISLIFAYVHEKVRDDKIGKQYSKYENVFAAAELLQKAKNNNGLRGITQVLGEEGRFEKISNKTYPEGEAPRIWWMNFRIEKYDTFANSIENFVNQGGEVYLITNHHNNHALEHRREEAYSNKNFEDYRQHFILQAREFIKLEERLQNAKGVFKVFFNQGSSSIPIFIESHDLDYRAYSGFYLNDLSGKLPYIEWETAGEGMVKKFKEYIDFKMDTSLTSEEMLIDPEIGIPDS